MAKGITIKDIARKFNCSVSTVSRALNHHPAINSDTVKNINEYALQNGYQKNAISLSLLNKSTLTLGLVVPSINFSHEHTIIKGLQEAVSPAGYMLNIGITNEKFSEEKRIIEKLLANRVDGLMISVSQESFEFQDFDFYYGLLKKEIPVLFIDRDMPDVQFSVVTTDDYLGAYIATQHLIDIGCKKLAFLSGPNNLTVCLKRKKGFIECIQKNGLEVNFEWIKNTEFDSQSAIIPIEELYKDSTNLPDGLFCVNDNVAYGASKGLTKLGIKIPQQTALIGFDNSPTSSFFTPSLSSIDRKSYEVGQTAGKMMLEMLEKENLSPQKIMLTPTLAVRNSSLK